MSRILCVDDNSRNLMILDELLSDDYEVECADSGEAALEAVARRIPSLILLDVMMPGISGYEVCELLKASPHTAAIPVVLVTAKAREEERERGLSVGAAAYLVKPFDPDALLDLVECHAPCRPDA